MKITLTNDNMNITLNLYYILRLIQNGYSVCILIRTCAHDRYQYDV